MIKYVIREQVHSHVDEIKTWLMCIFKRKKMYLSFHDKSRTCSSKFLLNWQNLFHNFAQPRWMHHILISFLHDSSISAIKCKRLVVLGGFLVLSFCSTSLFFFGLGGGGFLYYLRLTCSFQNADVGYPRKKGPKKYLYYLTSNMYWDRLREPPVNSMLEK